MIIRFLSWMLWISNLLICSTLRYKVQNEPPAHSLFAVWHGQTFPLLYWAQHRKLCIFPIGNWRGDTITYLANKYQYKTVRLKEKASPLERGENLLQLIKAVSSGREAAIAIDGPPEPLIYHKAKPGILYLSQKTKVPIATVKISIKRKLVLFWRWDKFEIPLPWSEVNICFGKPFITNGEISPQELEELMYAQS